MDLIRTTFETSRLMEFFDEKELTKQIGHNRGMWPVALLKELIDNALDACESAGVNPVIEVYLEKNSLSVQDNGPGIPPETIEKSLDYKIRVSDKNKYVSPSRGQQGNALKCVWAAPFVATGSGIIEIGTRGQLHEIDVSLDRLTEEPEIGHTITDDFVKNGTFVKIHWPEIALLSG